MDLITLRINSKSMMLWPSNLFGCRGTTWGREDLRQNRAWTKQSQAWGRKGNVTLSQSVWSQSFRTFSEAGVGRPPRETNTKQPNRASPTKRRPKRRDEKMKALHLDLLSTGGAGGREDRHSPWGPFSSLRGTPLKWTSSTEREGGCLSIQKARH